MFVDVSDQEKKRCANPNCNDFIEPWQRTIVVKGLLYHRGCAIACDAPNERVETWPKKREKK